jgi:hypothetical protein
MNMTNAPPATIPKKLYLLLTTLFPNGGRYFALTAKTYVNKTVSERKNRKRASWLTLKHCMKNIEKYTTQTVTWDAFNHADHTHQSTEPAPMPRLVAAR